MNLSPFEVERLRHNSAVNGDTEKFIELYSSKYPEIRNRNSSPLWDKLNSNSTDIRLADPMAFERVMFVVNQVRNGSRVLDLGMGSGNLENAFVTNNLQIDLIGVDISSKSINRASERFPDWKFYSKSVNDFGDDKKFDYVISLEVFEHISPHKVLKSYQKVRGLIKSKGLFIISVPLNEELEKMINNGVNPNAHVRLYTEAILEFELAISGFEIINRKILYAFHQNHYLKSFIARHTFGKFKPNNIVMVARTP